LVTLVAAAAKQPVIVIVTGSSVDLTLLKAHPRVGAILWRGYCGEAAGQATADLIFGAVSPSARLTHTFYPQSFVTAWKHGIDPYTGAVAVPRNASYFDHHVRPNATTGNPGRTHRFYTGKPVYKFGAGMSYATFSYVLLSQPQVQVGTAAVTAYAREATTLRRFIRPLHNTNNGGGGRAAAAAAAAFHVMRIQVTNTGPTVASAHSVLCFASAPAAGVDGAPLESLVDFQKVFLEPGESTLIEFKLVLHDITLTRLHGGLAVAEGNWTIAVGDLRTTVTVAV